MAVAPLYRCEVYRSRIWTPSPVRVWCRDGQVDRKGIARRDLILDLPALVSHSGEPTFEKHPA